MMLILKKDFKTLIFKLFWLIKNLNLWLLILDLFKNLTILLIVCDAVAAKLGNYLIKYVINNFDD